MTKLSVLKHKMEAPDKIYLVRDAVNPEGIFDSVASKNPMFYDDIAYIRKDALLEWAKAELSHADANIEAYPYENAYRGHREKIEELIEHIESL